jgi:hypothetical protein
MKDESKAPLLELGRQSPFSIEAGASQRRQSKLSVSILDQMTDDEQKAMLAALASLRDEEQ